MFTSNPTVSVIISTCNRAHLISGAIQCVLRQTFKDWEIIIVDDASSDQTKDVVDKFQNTRISYVRHSINKGGSAARNTGIRSARGVYIALLDDDDLWEKDKIEKQLKAIEHYDAVLCSYVNKSNNRGILYSKPLLDAADLRKGNPVGGCSQIMIKSSLMKNNLFDENLPAGQDWDLLIRLSNYYRIRYISNPLVIYNEGDHNRITNKKKDMPIEQLEEQLAVVNKHRAFLGEYWFNFHIANMFLSYIGLRKGKVKHILYVVRRCGLIAVLHNFTNKILQTISKSLSGSS